MTQLQKQIVVIWENWELDDDLSTEQLMERVCAHFNVDANTVAEALDAEAMEKQGNNGMNSPEQIAEKAALELSDWVSHNGVDFGWFKRCFLAAIIEATNKDAEILRLTELLSKADSRIVELKGAIAKARICNLEHFTFHSCGCDRYLQKVLSESNEKEGGV